MSALTDTDFAMLLRTRYELRRFLHASAEAARAAGLTPSQHQLLLTVRGSDDPDGPRIRDLADTLFIAHHSAVELVDRTAAAGLIERHPDQRDQRVVRVRLTERGAQVLDSLTPVHVRELRQLHSAFARLTDRLPGQDGRNGGADGAGTPSTAQRGGRARERPEKD